MSIKTKRGALFRMSLFYQKQFLQDVWRSADCQSKISSMQTWRTLWRQTVHRCPQK